MKTVSMFLVTLLLSYSVSAFADDGIKAGWFFGGGFGLSDGQVLVNQPHTGEYYQPAVVTNGSKTSSETEVAYRAFTGLNVFTMGPVGLGGEVGYANLGQFNDTVNVLDAGINLTVDLKFFELYGSAGKFHWDAVGDGDDTFYAAGISKSLENGFGLRLEGRRYYDIMEENMDVALLSFTYTPQ